jgi:DNA-binding NarL/FixJ family response regulator
MTHVGVVEDNNSIRTSIVQLFNASEGYHCECNFESFEDFFSSDCESTIDILIADIGLPGMSGIEGIKKLREKNTEVDIIMFTVYNDSEKIFNSLCAGASGYLLKSTPLSEIKKSVDIIVKGGSIMSPSIARKVMDSFSAKPKKKDYSLTIRENEVIQGLVDGLSYKLIAERLAISIDTVRCYIKSIYKKLYVNSKSEVIKKAFYGEI